MTKKTKLLTFLYCIILLTLLALLYVVPKVTGALTPTLILEYGSLQVTDDVHVFFSRNETVYSANTSGEINYYVSQDTQVRSGAKVMNITPGNVPPKETADDTGVFGWANTEPELDPIEKVLQLLGGIEEQTSDYTVAFNGCVSYFVDGYEGYFAPDSLAGISYKDAEKLDIEVVNLTRETARAGEPIYKICDNGRWYMTTWIKAGDIYKYETGKEVIVVLPHAEIPASVVALEDEGDMWQLTLTTNRYYDEFAVARDMDATIIALDYSGIIIPNSSITAVDGQAGVYVRTKSGEYQFTPVKVITSDGTDSIAYADSYIDADGNKVSTVKTYDEILKAPN